jgi:hypothetical protein
MSRHHRWSAVWSSQRPRRQRSLSERLPLTVRLLCLYPRAWRERYGAELAELLTDEPVTAMAIFHVLLGALDAHLHPSLLPAPRRSASDQLRAATLTVFCASMAFAVAALGFFEGVSDLALAPLMRTDPVLRLPWTIFAAGGVAAMLALVVGGVPILVAVVHEARTVRRRDLWLLAAPPPLSMVVLGGCDGVEELLRSHRIAVPAALGITLDLLFHALFVLAAVGCTAAVCVTVVHSVPRVRLLRFALAPAVLVTLAMATTMVATVVWLMRAHADGPNYLDQGPLALGFAVLLVLMVASTALAAGGVFRGLAAYGAARASLDALEC